MVYNELSYFSKTLYDLTSEEIKIIISWMEKEFDNYYLLFRTTGLWDNINNIKIAYNDYFIDAFMGDKNKLLIKKYPEIHFLFTEVSFIKKIFSYFCNTIYEGRYIYLFKANWYVNISNLLIKHVYQDNSLADIIYPYADCIIENTRGYDGGFSLVFHFKSKIMYDSLNKKMASNE